MFDLNPGSHTFGVDGDGLAQIAFNIDDHGKITYVSNPAAASVADVLIDGIQCSKLVLQTSEILINASKATYVLSGHRNPYPFYQRGNKKFYLIKGLRYYIASDFLSYTIPGMNYPGIVIPQSFKFLVDKNGDVQKIDTDLNSKLAAKYNEKKLKLNTIPVKIKLSDYRTKEIIIPGYGAIKKDSKLFFIRGLGIPLTFSVDSRPLNFYIIPM
jgi:hypothetical protein